MNIVIGILAVIFLGGFLFERNEKHKLKNRLLSETSDLEMENKLIEVVLQNVHAYILLIDSDFVVLKTNYYKMNGMLEPLDKRRVGDLLQCRNAVCALDGCGSGEYCKNCPIRQTIQHALDTQSDFTNFETSIVMMTDAIHVVHIEASISGSYFKFEDHPRMVLTIQDINSKGEK